MTESLKLSGRLRAETRQEHDAIETALAIPQSIGTIADYARLLAGFYGFYQPLEQAILALNWQGTGIDPAMRLKAPLLAADLEACGDTLDAIPRCPRIPACRDTADGFGCLYVLEGATLGGAIIHRQLQAQLGDWIEGRGHFYQCYGDQRGAMWRIFRQAVDGFGDSHGRALQDQVIHSARATFQDLQAWLDRR